MNDTIPIDNGITDKIISYSGRLKNERVDAQGKNLLRLETLVQAALIIWRSNNEDNVEDD